MMKKTNILIKLLFVLTITVGITSCEDFLNRPTEDQYTIEQFYRTDEQCQQAANLLYSSPWFDFIRGWLKVGDVQSGNIYWGGEDTDAAGGALPFMNLAVPSSSITLKQMSEALWAVNAHCNGVIENINMYAGPATTEKGRNAAKGEALVWKAMSYFYLVRIWGAVPIIHSNSQTIAEGNYNQLYKAKIENVYDYIILTLDQAVEWLPEHPKQAGRIDKYSAYALLAKVYLTKSGYGHTGSRSQEDLNRAKEYAHKVIYDSGRRLTLDYASIFRPENNISDESLIAWRWIVPSTYTCNNPLQSEFAAKGFDEYNCWGGYRGPSVDLQDAFGVTALIEKRSPVNYDQDKRRKVTMMMYGDHYDYFWKDKGGFDWTPFYKSIVGTFQTPTGANVAKHLVGNNADHVAALGVGLEEQRTGLATHVLRLGDIYLIYAEAILGNDASTSDAEALKAFNAVHHDRAGLPGATSITFEDIWKERHLELAVEGDYWYDFVRLSYYNPDLAISKLKAQHRKDYVGLDDYYKQDSPTIGVDNNSGKPTPRYNDDAANLNVPSKEIFYAKFPDTDLSMNPRLMEEPVEYDLNGYAY
ncbi:MAG: RagB/SusD family nutrient uptake outer membrane protein [Dysgonamonadaceae bacterium]|jgi:hypothetical protein|nr:RagB/SusD family nutrient uptake outer membrane protein [Dysgonamonadaceae bacterium]